MADYKQVILVRDDLKLSKGKMSAQVAHAAVDAVTLSDAEDVTKWREQGMKKSVLKVKDLVELMDYEQKAQKSGLVVAVVTDAGHTHLNPGTITCLAIGPHDEKRIDLVTGKLKLMN
ncbi:MAG TPA: peptidyl-tRNA hydrolase Pth2 [Candidatus Binatia bacterium]|nr:peptidyl-tRNA hydrolase Pth2 [Candidatus Binatia bacterium]